MASIPKSLHIVHGTLSTPDLLMKQGPQMERELLFKCIVARDRMDRQDRDRDLLSSFLPSPLGIGQSLGISFTCLEISELSLFDPLITGTGKLYLNDDNSWLYSLCDAIRQRYIFPFYNGLIYPSSPFRSQGILLINQSICIAIRAERPEKKTNRPINQFKLHPTSKHTTRTTETRSHPIPTYQRKSLSSRIFTHTYQPTPPSNVSLNSSSRLNHFIIRYM